MKLAGILALVLFAAHAVDCVARGVAGDALWACHFACAVLGVGFLFDRPRWFAVGALWLVLGTPLWLADIALGAELDRSSVWTHAGGFVLAIWGVARRGLPRGSWRLALLALGALQLLSRALTARELNVNAAFGVYERFTNRFDSYLSFEAAAALVAASAFCALETAARRIADARSEDRERVAC